MTEMMACNAPLTAAAATTCYSPNTTSAAIHIQPYCASSSPPLYRNSTEILSQSPLDFYSSYSNYLSTSSTSLSSAVSASATSTTLKLRNPLGLKLLIAASTDTNRNDTKHGNGDSGDDDDDEDDEYENDEDEEEEDDSGNEGNNNKKRDEAKLEWKNNECLGSSSPCSPSSHSTASRDSTCDSGFSSDDNSLTKRPSRKLSRTKSLRSALRTPTSSGPHKSVRFADALGLDLEQKTVYDADDWRDNEFNAFSSPFSYPTDVSNRHRRIAVHLITTNWSIRTEAEVSHLTRTQCVCLKSVDTVDTNLNGVVDVLNLAPEKQVCIRYTVDNWDTFSEVHAIYMQPIGNDGAVDAFTFFVSFPSDLPVDTKCQFCIRYTVNGTSYWDSNGGANYTLQYVQSSSNDQTFINNKVIPKQEPINAVWGVAKLKSQKFFDGFSAHKFNDYLPNPSTSIRNPRNSGWGHCGYSYDNEVGFY